jgi:hypothetical protein
MADSRHSSRRQRLRQALISAWRGADEPEPQRQAFSVADLVVKVAEDSGVGQRLKLEEVNAAWRGAVGDFLAAHAHPQSIDRGVLLIRILQPTVHHVLQGRRREILSRLKAVMGARAPRDLRLKVG